MRMLQLGDELDLAAEPVHARRRREIRREDLHHHLAIERDIGREEDLRHPATAELALDPIVRAERLLQRGLERGVHQRGLNAAGIGCGAANPSCRGSLAPK